jgi:hypothetical protein
MHILYCSRKLSHILYSYILILSPHALKGQSHEKVGEMSVWGISLGPN